METEYERKIKLCIEKKNYNVNLAAKIAQGTHEYHQMQITP